MSRLFEDTRFALRIFRRQPVFSAIVIGTLAAGAAAATVIFGLVNAVLYASFDVYREPDRLVYVLEQNVQIGATGGVSAATLADWSARARAFEHLAGAEPGSAAVVRAGAEPESVRKARLTDGLLSMLDAQPFAGRLFNSAEHAGNAPVILLSHAYWVKAFGGSPGIVGRSLKIDGSPATVVGVLSPRFTLAPFLGSDASIYTPGAVRSGHDRTARTFMAIGRLRQDATASEANAQLASISAQIAASDPASRGWTPWTISPRSFDMSGDAQFLIVLAVGVALVLAIACANVVSVMLARSAGRAREVATRLAVGAGRLAIARQLLTESLVLGAAAGLTGLFLAWAGCRGLNWWIAGGSLARVDVRIDHRVLLFSTALSFLMALGVGALPSVRIARLPVWDALKDAGSLWGALSAGRLRKVLVAGEVGLVMVLLTSTGLVLQGLINLRGNDPGFRVPGLLTFQLTLPESRYPDAAARALFVRDVVERLEARPSFASVAVTTVMPAVGSEPAVEPFTLEGRQPDPRTKAGAEVLAVSPGYYRTVGIPILKGRAPADSTGRTADAVVSQRFVERWMNGEEPIGARVNVSGRWRTIVGVAGDVRTFHLNVAPRPAIYIPYSQQPSSSFWIVLRAVEDDRVSLIASAKREIHLLDREQPVRGGEWAATLIEKSMGGFDLTGLIAGVLSVAAVGLAILGLYGIVELSVTRRTRELGVRIAMGAAPARIVRSVMGEAVVTAAWGAAPGLLLALLTGRLLASKLHRVSPFDPMLLATVCATIFVTVALASWGPAHRAARIDPLSTLRAE